MSHFTESIVEDAALDWLSAPGYIVLDSPDVTFEESCTEMWFREG